MPTRAFLCHSSEDKDYVRRVAEQLGRAKVIFDEVTFTGGEDFRALIRSHLDRAAIFVFFASEKSIASAWCQFELDEAEMRRMTGGIAGQLTFVIDSAVTLKSVPLWLQRSKIEFRTRAAQAARDIQQHAVSMMAPEVKQPWMGREADLLDFAKKIAPVNQKSPRLLVSRGLAGVGRRSFLERALQDYLSLPFGPFLTISQASGLDDLFLFLIDEVRDLTDRTAAAKELDAFHGMDVDDQADEVAELLIEVSKGRTVPCLIDERAMLTPEGRYLPMWQRIIEIYFERTADNYLAILHTRRPIPGEALEAQCLDSHIGPLDHPATVRLYSRLLQMAGVSASQEKIDEVSQYVAGYPPAAQFASQLTKSYGIDVVLADKRDLEDFKAGRFQRFLEELLELTEQQWSILTYLGGERGLPFEALRLALGIDNRSLANDLKALVDLSLIRLTGTNYTASAPVLTALYRVKPMPSKEFYAGVAQRLDEAYWSDESDTPPFAVIDASLHATAMSGRTHESANNPFVRISTMYRAAQESYYKEDFQAALGYGRRAQEMGATGHALRDRQIRETVFKSLIKLRAWKEAESELRLIEKANDTRFYFLKGFGLRAQGKMDQALSAYRSALRVGDARTAVHREIAFCLMNTGKYEEAIHACHEALAKDHANLYVLDTLVSSYIGMKDYPKAKLALDKLGTVDISGKFTHHRLASYYAAVRQYDRALAEADAATSGGRGRFEAFGQRVNILIDSGKFAEARDALVSLETQFPRSRGDVVTGLRCKSEVRQGRWREAEKLWLRLEQQHTPVHQGLLKSVLVLKAEDRMLPILARQDAKRQADRIILDMTDFDNAMSILTLSDDEVSNVLGAE